MLGWTEDELIGQPIELLIPERSQVAHQEQRASFEREPEAREMGGGRELFARNKSGDELPVEIGLSPFVSHGRSYTLATIVDLSARREMAERMLASQRLATLGTLAASVAHEVNNPNAFITANLESLRRLLSTMASKLESHEMALAECSTDLREAQATIDDSLEGVGRVNAIVAQLGVLTRAPTSDDPRSELRLNDIVRWACLLVQGQVLERAQLVLELGDDLPVLMGYSGPLSQVVTNLLANALQSVPPGAPEQHRIVVTTGLREGWLSLEIEDTGVGMDEETHQNAFRRFFTTKPIGEGSGLGLPISREIVEAHGGRLLLRPRPEGSGTRAVVELPVRDGSAPPRETGRTPARATDQPRARILVVDDDPAIRRAYRRVLRPHLVEQADGLGAWQRFSEGDVDFDMVLCDVTMPGLDGPSLFERVRKRWPHLASRFVFSTGGAVSPHARSLLDEVSNPVLFKPASRTALLGALDDRRDAARKAAE